MHTVNRFRIIVDNNCSITTIITIKSVGDRKYGNYDYKLVNFSSFPLFITIFILMWNEALFFVRS